MTILKTAARETISDSAVKIVDLPRIVNENKCTGALFPGLAIRFHSNNNKKIRKNQEYGQLANMRTESFSCRHEKLLSIA